MGWIHWFSFEFSTRLATVFPEEGRNLWTTVLHVFRMDFNLQKPCDKLEDSLEVFTPRCGDNIQGRFALVIPAVYIDTVVDQ